MGLRKTFFGKAESCLDINHLSCGPMHLKLVGLTAGRLAVKIWVEFKGFKILYWLNYSDCYFF